MFGSLKKKLSGWFKKKPEEEPEVEEKKEEKQVEEKKEEVKKEEEKVEEKPAEKKEEVKEEPVEKEGKQVEERPKEKKKAAPKETAEEVIETAEVKEEKKEKKPQLADVETVVAEKEEEEKKEELGFFAKIKKKLIDNELTRAQFDDAFEDLEMSLLENNVALEVVDKIHDSLAKDLVDVSISKSKIEETIVQSLKDAILDVLIESEDVIEKIKSSKDPFVVLFFGINGSGKTTSVAKFASKLRAEGITSVLGAADTFRAASIEQLEEHASKVGVPIVKGEYGADPSSVAFDAIQYAKKNKIQAVLIDTAGRMYTQGNLMREMEKIVRVSKPDFKMFVGESITGNDAVEQAKSFNDTVGIDGIILTKADVDEKAGTILSVGFVTGKPVLYLGVGQEYKDLKEFKKEDVLEGLGLE